MDGGATSQQGAICDSYSILHSGNKSTDYVPEDEVDRFITTA